MGRWQTLFHRRSAHRSVIRAGKLFHCPAMEVSPCSWAICFRSELELPVKVIVFKNNALAFVELEMKAAGILEFATELHNPDFAKIADGAGVLGLTAETPDQVRPMISKALKHDGPALVEVLVHRQELSMPPTITLEQMKGFSVFALKAVLSGRGDEIVDLARVNLFR